MNFAEWLNQKLNLYAYQMESELFFHVYDERDFEDTSIKGRLQENEIAVVVSALPTELSYYVEVKPFSVYCLLTDAVDFQTALELIRGFATENNFISEMSAYTDDDGNTYKKIVKYQFEQPQIAQDFTYYGNDYASVAILGATETVIDKVAEMTAAELDGDGEITQGDSYGITFIYKNGDDEDVAQTILPLSFSIVLTSSTNTETFANVDVGQSIVTASTLTMSFSLPAITNELTKRLYKSFSTKGTGRNAKYRFAFFLDGNEIDGEFSLITNKYETAPDASPMLSLGFTL